MEGVAQNESQGDGVGWLHSVGELNFTRGFPVDFASTGRPRNGIPQGRVPKGAPTTKRERSTDATLRIAAEKTLQKTVTPGEEQGARRRVTLT